RMKAPPVGCGQGGRGSGRTVRETRRRDPPVSAIRACYGGGMPWNLPFAPRLPADRRPVAHYLVVFAALVAGCQCAGEPPKHDGGARKLPVVREEGCLALAEEF